MTGFMGGSIAGVTGDDDGRNGVIIVLLINFTVWIPCGYALKYAANPPISKPISNVRLMYICNHFLPQILHI